MARKSERVVDLEEAILGACELIDNCDQSRTALSDGMDNIRQLLADGYGEEFEDDLAVKMGYELIDDEDESDDDFDIED
jgi:hypothetical protein